MTAPLLLPHLAFELLDGEHPYPWLSYQCAHPNHRPGWGSRPCESTIRRVMYLRHCAGFVAELRCAGSMCAPCFVTGCSIRLCEIFVKRFSAENHDLLNDTYNSFLTDTGAENRGGGVHVFSNVAVVCALHETRHTPPVGSVYIWSNDTKDIRVICIRFCICGRLWNKRWR